MGKRRQQALRHSAEPPPAPAAPGINAITLLTLAGLVGASLISAASWQKIGFIEQRLTDRLDRIEILVSRAMAQAAATAVPPAPQQQRQSGPDPDRVYDIKLAGAPARGPAAAPITIAEFSDFQCPFCARVGSTLEKIEAVYGNQVRIVWKHLPLNIHPLAPGAHLAAVAAQQQGKFWEFHDRVFANQRQLDNDTYRQYARELELDLERFDRDLLDPATQQIIDADVAEATSMQIPSTPGFFINGRYLRGAKPFEDFARLINAELTRLNLPVPEETQGG